MGSHEEALQLINENSTVEEAIKYCKDVDEQYLWDQLIESSKVSIRQRITFIVDLFVAQIEAIAIYYFRIERWKRFEIIDSLWFTFSSEFLSTLFHEVIKICPKMMKIC